jgi:hypothetical protein
MLSTLRVNANEAVDVTQKKINKKKKKRADKVN